MIMKLSSELEFVRPSSDWTKIKGLHIIYRGYGAVNIYKNLFKKVLAPSEEHEKQSLPRIQLLQKKFVSRLLKKFLYLSGKVLLLFETLNFQKEINSKRQTPFNV